MGQALRGGPDDRRGGRRTLKDGRESEVWGRELPRRRAALAAPVSHLLLLLLLVAAPAFAQDDAPLRIESGRFTFVLYPADENFARSLLASALAADTFPGLPRPRQPVHIAIAPDARRFRQWIGPTVPEWGAAVAFPAARRIVMQGRRSGSDAGNPFEVLRHELAHLALHEAMGELPPRWFDEGYAAYAAGERARAEILAANFALALRGVPTLDELDELFEGGSSRAQTGYALGYQAVSDIAALDPQRGLAIFFMEWRERRTFDGALRAAYGTTQASFEADFVRRTRLRYGLLALFVDTSLGLAVFMGIVLPLYLARRRRNRERMAALIAADEAAERAAGEGMLAELLGPPVPPEYPG
ncbi:MAG: hypothetical protein H0X64_00875 [Gemmatimonadaceae bacterium]|nr:hypothetical protein [Gemmatimonadaceae bacterium]